MTCWGQVVAHVGNPCPRFAQRGNHRRGRHVLQFSADRVVFLLPSCWETSATVAGGVLMIGYGPDRLAAEAFVAMLRVRCAIQGPLATGTLPSCATDCHLVTRR